ncbi:MAG: hypothetical protein Q4D58_09040 [Synergistaceae bacterium]|nr:hypothetical protein [Synergistaceae bacterium]
MPMPHARIFTFSDGARGEVSPPRFKAPGEGRAGGRFREVRGNG